MKNLIFAAFLTLFIPFSAMAEIEVNKTVLLHVLAKDKEHSLPYYLKCIDNLDYNKKLISVYIETSNNKDETAKVLIDWTLKNKLNYKKIIFDDRSNQNSCNPDDCKEDSSLGKSLDESLQKAKENECDYYFIVNTNSFVNPCTLKDLIKKDKPIIAPMLRTIPNRSYLYSNFFADIDARGYYKSHPKYLEILTKDRLGTFRVPLVHCTYLIKTSFIDKLSYIDGTDDYEFIIFSRNARKNNINQFICNEKDFGVLLHNIDMSNIVDSEKDALDQYFSLEKYDKLGVLKESKIFPFNYNLCATPRGYYVTRKNDQFIGSVMTRGVHWEEDLIKACLKFIKKDSTVIDIGSNIGTHTIPWAKKAKKVYAFEPQRIIFQQLCTNVLLNDVKNVFVYNIALGHRACFTKLDATVPAIGNFSKEKPLTYDDMNNQINFGGVRLGNDGEEVEMRTLDSFKLSNVSMIKIDVEGAEPMVFYGAKDTILRNKPVIIYEKIASIDVTKEMIESLNLKEEVYKFDIEEFVKKEMPDVYLPAQDFFGNQILIPKNN